MRLYHFFAGAFLLIAAAITTPCLAIKGQPPTDIRERLHQKIVEKEKRRQRANPENPPPTVSLLSLPPDEVFKDVRIDTKKYQSLCESGLPFLDNTMAGEMLYALVKASLDERIQWQSILRDDIKAIEEGQMPSSNIFKVSLSQEAFLAVANKVLEENSNESIELDINKGLHTFKNQFLRPIGLLNHMIRVIGAFNKLLTELQMACDIATEILFYPWQLQQPLDEDQIVKAPAASFFKGSLPGLLWWCEYNESTLARAQIAVNIFHPFLCALEECTLSQPHKELIMMVRTDLRNLTIFHGQLIGYCGVIRRQYANFLSFQNNRWFNWSNFVVRTAFHPWRVYEIVKSWDTLDTEKSEIESRFGAEFTAIKNYQHESVIRQKKREESRRQQAQTRRVQEIKNGQEISQMREERRRASMASEASARPPLRLNTDPFFEWWYDTEERMSATLESKREAAEQLERDHKKQTSKASKNHVISESSASSTSSTSSSSTSSSSSSSNVIPDVRPVLLNKANFEAFSQIMNDENREIPMDRIRLLMGARPHPDYDNSQSFNQVKAFVDNGSGDRVRVALPYRDESGRAVRVIHDHLAYGHKGLEGGRRRSLREMFREAGYSLDNVRQIESSTL